MASVYPSSIACKLKIGWPSGSEDFFFFIMVTFCFAVFVYLFYQFLVLSLFCFVFVVVVAFLTTGLIVNSLFPSKTSLVKLVTILFFSHLYSIFFLLIYLINLSYVSFFFCHSCLSSAPSGNVQYRREEVTIWLAVLSM